jgi:hypothetical protein
MVDAPTAERKRPGKVALNQDTVTSGVGVERVLYEQLVSEGVKEAADWKHVDDL